ncbi:PREDICTED: putative helicase mov-10-B.1 isoform X1 [Polistes canadensis]|uniref:putative helicase mov-10-B.1 isoform X1 n=1 Tax=Polistes canadensis TaxID=91411 RepID=UPI000718B24D|nr:PREDICTED: putative helicase mov-10-B.1 isoform X1 [Polistes canadensis]
MTKKFNAWSDSRLQSDLRIALENNLEISESYSKRIKRYINLIKNLKNIKIIEEKDYCNLFQILLYVEHFEKSKLKENILKGWKLKKKGKNIFTIFAPFLIDDDSLVKVKDKIILKETTLNNIDECSYYAKVVKISKSNIDFVINNKFLLTFSKRKRYNISLIESEWSMRICHYALKQIHCYFKSLIYPTIGTNRNCLNLDLKWFNVSIKKNSEQKQVVINVLNMTAHPAPYILFGPPGTGKTATLVEIICQAWKKELSRNVLVCAPSNKAVDEITKRLLNYVSPTVISRIYSQSHERSKVDKTILPCSHFLKDNSDILNNKFLLSHQIILVTIITCGSVFVSKRVKKDNFSYIIIDEASQATEPETMIPFLLGSKNNNKSQIVLAGDPHQLAPVVVSRFAKPLLGISMLKRLMDHSLYKQNEQNNYDQHYVTKLKRNYRNHECILHVSNQEFYGNELIACGDAQTVNRAIGWSTLPNKKFPIIFHSSNGTEMKKDTYSIYNLEEISIIMDYLQLLLGKKLGGLKIKQKHIGIVSPYKRQKIEIIKRLEKKNWHHITVGTVETLQGCEKEIIILTTVRSRVFKHNGIEDIGFLSDEKRLNVALTRAKCLLIVIGNPIVLETNKHWKVLVEYCRENKAFIESSSVLKEKSQKKKKRRKRRSRKLKKSVKEKIQGKKEQKI